MFAQLVNIRRTVKNNRTALDISLFDYAKNLIHSISDVITDSFIRNLMLNYLLNHMIILKAEHHTHHKQTHILSLGLADFFCYIYILKINIVNTLLAVYLQCSASVQIIRYESLFICINLCIN